MVHYASEIHSALISTAHEEVPFAPSAEASVITRRAL